MTLERAIASLPRVRLITLPTPLEEAPRLAASIGLKARLFIKRDDAMELAFGGNKARKLEFIFADAKRKGADTVITTGSLDSNHVRLTSAASGKLGMKTVLILRGSKPQKYGGNLLLDQLLGAEIRFLEAGDIQEEMQRTADELSEQGRKPYVIPGGGANPLGVAGYANAALELFEQLRERGLTATHLVHGTGTGATQAGLILGAKAMNLQQKVLGISCGRSATEIKGAVRRLVDESAQFLQLQINLNSQDLTVFEEYTGGGYAIITPEVIDTIRLVARTEGTILDPVYTGKAMQGLIDLARKGHFSQGDSVIFIHTGGTPILFGYAHKFQS